MQALQQQADREHACRVPAIDSIFFNLPNLHFIPCPVVASKVRLHVVPSCPAAQQLPVSAGTADMKVN